MKIKSNITNGDHSLLYSIVNSLLKGNLVFAQPTWGQNYRTIDELTHYSVIELIEEEKKMNVHSAQYLQEAKHDLHGLEKKKICDVAKKRVTTTIFFFLIKL